MHLIFQINTFKFHSYYYIVLLYFMKKVEKEIYSYSCV